MKVVVIGASHAGVGFVDAMRRRGFDGELTLLDSRKGLPLERPPLSKAFLLEESAESKFALRKADWYDQHDVRLLDGSKVVGINVASRDVTLETGEHVAYDRLVLAMGARPRRLPTAGDIGGIYVLRDPDDARRLRAAACAANAVAVVGGG